MKGGGGGKSVLSPQFPRAPVSGNFLYPLLIALILLLFTQGVSDWLINTLPDPHLPWYT